MALGGVFESEIGARCASVIFFRVPFARTRRLNASKPRCRPELLFGQRFSQTRGDVAAFRFELARPGAYSRAGSFDARGIGVFCAD